VGASVGGMLGPGGPDADGSPHPGLPWAGCSILGATAEELLAVREAARALNDAATVPAEGASTAGTAVSVYLTDMPQSAQTNRVYDGYLAELATTAAADLHASALSIVGPRKQVDRLTKRLTLL
jgi:hypothetical protein